MVVAAARADFLQRVRSFRFVAVLMATLAISGFMLPPLDANYVVMQLGNARGIFNSAWVGFVFGTIASQVLPLLGFFVIKDTVQRDRQTRVGALLAATPLTKLQYVTAKFASNVAIFASIVAVSIVVAAVMQVWRAEDLAPNPLVIAAHVVLLAAPSLLAVSALGVLFECLPVLRGAVGNVVFFFLWGAVLSFAVANVDQDKDSTAPMFRRQADLFGVSAPLADFERRLDAAVPRHARGFAIGVNVGRHIEHRIRWPGMLGDGGWIAQRIGWSFLFVPLLLGAALAFDRFDPARTRRRGEGDAAPKDHGIAEVPTQWHALTPLASTPSHWRPFSLVVAELKLLLWRQPWWWYAGAAGFWIAGFATPLEGAMSFVVPTAWFWALTRWSEHGARAEVHDTCALLASSASPIARQLPAQWLAAIVMGLLLVAPVLIRLLGAVQPGTIAQTVAGAGFVSALALACGSLSRGPRLFEMVLLLLWYACLQRVPGTAYGGDATLAFMQSSAPTYLMLSAVLLALVVLARRRTT